METPHCSLSGFVEGAVWGQETVTVPRCVKFLCRIFMYGFILLLFLKISLLQDLEWVNSKPNLKAKVISHQTLGSQKSFQLFHSPSCVGLEMNPVGLL